MHNPFTTNDSTWRTSDSRTTVSDHLAFPSQIGNDTSLYLRATRTGTDASATTSLPALELFNANAATDKHATTDFSPNPKQGLANDFARAVLDLGMPTPGPVDTADEPRPTTVYPSKQFSYNEFGGVNIPGNISGLGAAAPGQGLAGKRRSVG